MNPRPGEVWLADLGWAAKFRLSSMLISASEGYATERPLSETGLLPRLDALHVPDGD